MASDSPEVYVAVCPCGKRAQGTFAELVSAGWKWSIGWRGWLCRECRVFDEDGEK